MGIKIALKEDPRPDPRRVFLLGAALLALQDDRLFPVADELMRDSRPTTRNDWHALVHLAIQSKLLPSLARVLRNTDSPVTASVAALDDVIRQSQELLFTEAFRAVDHLDAQGIDCMLLKSGDLCYSTYPTDLPRQVADIDFMVKPTDVERARTELRKLGYQQANIDRDTLRLSPLPAPSIAQAEARHYEMVPFLALAECRPMTAHREDIMRYLPRTSILPKGDSTFQLITLDVHFNVSVSIDLDDLWSNNRWLEVPSRTKPYRCQGATELLWFISGRCYSELFLHNAITMRDFVDALSVCASMESEIDWARLARLCERYGMKPSLYYVLSHISDLLNGAIPEEAVCALDFRGGSSTQQRDWGDFLPRMLGASPLRLRIA